MYQLEYSPHRRPNTFRILQLSIEYTCALVHPCVQLYTYQQYNISSHTSQPAASSSGTHHAAGSSDIGEGAYRRNSNMLSTFVGLHTWVARPARPRKGYATQIRTDRPTVGVHWSLLCCCYFCHRMYGSSARTETRRAAYMLVDGADSCQPHDDI